FPFYSARILFSSTRERTTLIILCYLYGGFDFLWWVSHSSLVPVHSEWWAGELGFAVQFSSFVTLSLWTPQHLLAGVSAVFALYVLANSKGAIPAALAGVFFASAVFSSPFAALGALPLIAWFFIRFRQFSALPACGLTFNVVSLPLWWILLGNDSF